MNAQCVMLAEWFGCPINVSLADTTLLIAIQRNTLWCDIHCVFSAPRIEQRCRMTTENSQSHRCRLAHTLIQLYMCMRRIYSAFYRCGTNVGYSVLSIRSLSISISHCASV